MRRWLSRRGQIVIPAMLIFPTLVLFVYLIYETAKLSREKIKHQFALDAAAFVEMVNYSDFLNRTAYVNGAFPMRIMQQGYNDWKAEPKPGHDAMTFGEILYKNGVYPRSASGGKDKEKFEADEKVWDIAYDDSSPSSGRNSDPPNVGDTLERCKAEDAYKYYVFKDFVIEFFSMWNSVYSLLGNVEEAQYQVIKRLGQDTHHSFLQKSYWLNTGDPPSYGTQLATNWDVSMGEFKTEPHCLHHVKATGMYYKAGGGLSSEKFKLLEWEPTGPGCGSSGGIFQMQSVDKNFIKKLRSPNGGNDYPGLPLTLAWGFPSNNYFNVDFVSVMHQPPVLHTTVAVGVASEAAVWPKPTPKFQVRQYP